MHRPAILSALTVICVLVLAMPRTAGAQISGWRIGTCVDRATLLEVTSHLRPDTDFKVHLQPVYKDGVTYESIIQIADSPFSGKTVSWAITTWGKMLMPEEFNRMVTANMASRGQTRPQAIKNITDVREMLFLNLRITGVGFQKIAWLKDPQTGREVLMATDFLPADGAVTSYCVKRASS